MHIALIVSGIELIVIIVGFIYTRNQNESLKSNCIATLTAEVKENTRKVDAICLKHDVLIEDMTGLKISIAKLEQKVKDKFGDNFNRTQT